MALMRLGEMIDKNCAVARHLEARIRAEPELELLSPAYLSIVCFRYRGEEPDRINADIIADLQESGIAAPSALILNGQVAIRAAIVNHRTETRDVDALVDAALSAWAAQKPAPGAKSPVLRKALLPPERRQGSNGARRGPTSCYYQIDFITLYFYSA